MKNREIKIPYRGIIRLDGNVWVAMSLEFGLAAQADSEYAAKLKLKAQVKEYVEDALSRDKKYQRKLLNRTASYGLYCRYYWESFKSLFKKGNNSTVFYSGQGFVV